MKDFGFQWHLTNRCNQRCKHCYQQDFSDEGELDFDTQKRVAKRIFNAITSRTVSVNLTGGEPLLLPWLGDMVEYLHTFRNLGEIYIITNGTKRPTDQLGKLLAQKKVTGLKVSLESGDPDLNDQIRGKDNFASVSSNLKEFVHNGYEFTLMVTLAR